MRKATLTRTETGETGTFGILVTDSGFSCYTGELPWKNNIQGKSSIPDGIYQCIRSDSTKHGMCYHVQGVTGRTDIEIHSANWMGDVDKGLKCQLLGCIAPGRAIIDIIGQKGVSSSRDALYSLEEDLEKKPFELTIKWSNGVLQKNSKGD